MPRMDIGRIQLPHGAILHDASLGLDVRRAFELETLRAQGAVTDAQGGRGSISFIRLGDARLVLRRYLRGGLAARLSKDRYFWLGEERTRAFREFRLLAQLLELALPVPRPVAARYRHDLLTYRGELVTQLLPDAESLAQRWLAGRACRDDWECAGRCIRRFHDAGVQHADLNAHNIMLDDHGGAWLLDFDRGRMREPGPWREAVLERLSRSLRKIGTAVAGDDSGWREGFGLLKAAHDASPT